MIRSILDNDLYKFTMQQAVVQLYPDTRATYEFINRTPSDKFNRPLLEALLEHVGRMSELRLTPDQRRFLAGQCPFFTSEYLQYLADYRYNPDEVAARLDEQGRLSLEIDGPWQRTILWEVPLLALVSGLYFQHVDTAWSNVGQVAKIRAKGELLSRADCPFADFGTRRRRNYASQDRIVSELRTVPGFLGTSNVHLAQVHGVKPVGTMAHEFIMAQCVLADMRHANRHALEAWYKVYRGELGIALTDTYGTDAFFADFDARLAGLYDGIRQDSGCPFAFADRAIAHYEKLGIDPATKTIVFSDGLTPELAVRIRAHCGRRVGCAFGIGTNLTNDFDGSHPLNIVIKLKAIDGVPVAKLTDDPSKASGPTDALQAAQRTFLGQSSGGQ